MMKNIHCIIRNGTQRKFALFLLSSVLSVLLLAEAIIVPSFAAAADGVTGYETKSTTVYTPFETLNGTSVSDATVKESSSSSTWKFAVLNGSGTNVFKTTNAQMGLTGLQVADGVKLSWSKPESASGAAVLKIVEKDGEFNKEYMVENNSFVAELENDKVYDIQVSYNNSIASEILTFKVFNIYGTESIVRSDGKETGVIPSDVTSEVFTVKLDADMPELTDQAAILIKIDSKITNDAYKATHQYDSNTESRVELADNKKFDLSQAYLGFDVNLRTSNSKYYSNDSYVIDNISKQSKTNSNYVYNLLQYSHNGSYTSGGFYQGYLLLALDNDKHTDAIEDANTNKELKFTFNNFSYFWHVPTRASKVTYSMLSQYDTEFKDKAYTDTINTFIGRTVTVSEVSIIPDYDKFLATGYLGTNADTETKNLIRDVSSDYSVQGVDYTYLQSEAKPATVVEGDDVKDYYINLTAENVESSYKFYHAALTGNREIVFTAKENEVMSFGFKAPAAGSYEVSAPLSIKDFGKQTVKYRVVKENSNGQRNLLQDEKTYTSATKDFCLLVAELAEGDTVYFEAWSDTDATEINIGFPQFVLNNANSSTGGRTYQAINYIETSNSNLGANFYSTDSYNYVANTNSSWNFGYFSIPVQITETDSEGESTTDVYTDGYNTVGKKYEVESNDANKIASSSVDSENTALIESLRPYELLHTGSYYNALLICQDDDGVITTSSTDKINRFAYAKTTKLTSVAIKSSTQYAVLKGATVFADGKYYNIGSYQQFTAPESGNATLTFTSTTGRFTQGGSILLVLRGSTVIHNGNTKDGATLTINDLKQGEVITVCQIDSSDKNLEGCISTLQVDITPTATSNITFNTDTVDYGKAYVNLTNGTTVKLPQLSPESRFYFAGWKDEAGNLIPVGTDYTVNGDEYLTAAYALLGDLDKDGFARAADLTKLRKYLLGNANDVDFADVNLDGSDDIRDLVHLKKIIAGIN